MRFQYAVLAFLSLGPAALGCAAGADREGDGDGDPAAPARALPGASASAHEPMVELFPVSMRAFDPHFFNLSGLDRDARLSFNWWTNGTPYPSLFRLTGTSPSGAITSSGDLSSSPVLAIHPLPGETTLRVDIEQQSQAPDFRINFLAEQEITAAELGVCGDQIRDLFVRWVNSREPWRGNPWYIYAHETPPAAIQLTWRQGVSGAVLDYKLRGVLDGTMGPILAVQVLSNNRLALNALLFHDQQGQLRKTVNGLFYLPLVDGNLLVSSALADGQGVTERVMSVSRSGDVAWSRIIDGPPPGRVVVTAVGNFVMPWTRSGAGGIAGGLPTFDPRTGADVAESFVDRGELCTGASSGGSSDPTCAASRDRVLERFEQWWNSAWPTLVSQPYLTATAHEVCSAQTRTCVVATLNGWMGLGPEDVLEVAIDSREARGSSYQNRLLFIDDTGRRSIGGKLIRRLGPDRLLVSSGMTDSRFVPRGSGAWYGAQETLTAVGAHGATVWRQVVNGLPALAPASARGTIANSGGFLLAQNQLFWTAYETYDGQLTSYNRWLDLATGALLPTPPKPALQGVCRP
jgi:hypothetical protein